MELTPGSNRPITTFEDAFIELLLDTYRMHPDVLPDAIVDVANQVGGDNIELLLVDLEQRNLQPIAGGGAPLTVDDGEAGEAFRTVRPVVRERERGHRLWLPLLDSSERIGVMVVDVEHVDDEVLRQWQALASLAGELIVSKTPYGDGLALARRTRQPTLAAELRWAMLPPLAFHSPQVSIAGILEPAYEIAGDTFDYALNGSIAHFAILDAMGHGLEASRMANLAVTSYRHSRRCGSSLQDMVRDLDATISEQFGPSRFVTGQLATLDTETGRFTMLNLGHPLPLLLRGGRVIGEVECQPCLPAGLGSVPTVLAETQLEPGDQVLLHTDGVTEARGQAPEEFGTERLVALVDELLAAGEGPPELLRRVIEEVLDFQGHRARDDATLLLVGWRT